MQTMTGTKMMNSWVIFSHGVFPAAGWGWDDLEAWSQGGKTSEQEHLRVSPPRIERHRLCKGKLSTLYLHILMKHLALDVHFLKWICKKIYCFLTCFSEQNKRRSTDNVFLKFYNFTLNYLRTHIPTDVMYNLNILARLFYFAEGTAG